MIKPSDLCLLGLSLLLFSAGAFADGKERVNRFLAEVKSMEAEFTQTVLDERSRPIDNSAGRFYLQRPDRFRWSYTEPYAQEIIADGRVVLIYDSELEQVTVKRMEGALDNTPAMLLSSDRPAEENFLVEDGGVAEGLEWVILKPRSKESSFTSLRLGFAGDDLARMELVDTLGQSTHLGFSKQQTNVELDPELFRFIPPEGTDVIRDDQ